MMVVKLKVPDKVYSHRIINDYQIETLMYGDEDMFRILNQYRLKLLGLW